MIELSSFLIGLLLSAIVTFISYKIKFLSLSGSLGAFLIGTIIFGLGGLKWSVPILFFFISSSILSVINPGKNSDKVKLFFSYQPRNISQVFANGIIPTLILIADLFLSEEIFVFLYIASIASVCADTWGTEIGTWTKRTTYNITTLKRIIQGQSGGISFVGTIGAFLGSAFVTASSLIYIDLEFDYFVFIVISGLTGSMIDSVLGSTVQVKYLCSRCSNIVEKEEHCKNQTIYYSGYKFINNDSVNLLAGISGVVVFLFFYLI